LLSSESLLKLIQSKGKNVEKEKKTKSFVEYSKEEAKGQKTYRVLSLSGVQNLFFYSDNFLVKKNCSKKYISYYRKNFL